MEQKTLNFRYQTPADNPNAQTMIFLHGLFGDLNNLGSIARAFANEYAILQIDLPNHGNSFHTKEMNYPQIAQHLNQLLTELNIHNAIVIGHSMGGKSAMALAQLAPEKVGKLVVIDIAPVGYTEHRHQRVMAGLSAIKAAKPATRQQAKSIMAEHIKDEGVQQFMLKSFDAQSQHSFRFNLTALQQHYSDIMGWTNVSVQTPTLFIKGGLSDYILPEHTQTILAQFPQATFFVIANASHWLHAEKPDTVIRAITKFLENKPTTPNNKK